ncbi:Mu transposase C-terminal domain-containing protein [Algimonas porphyrae]|uniref:transposase family protein n=1 Tax=Algimonas porphyrae TaxID=1128113 RepID=UPI0024E0C49B|nr:transposase family protein [Algimonas porphyrae]
MKDKRIADARGLIVSEIEAFTADAMCAPSAAAKAVKAAYDDHSFIVPNWAREAIPGFTVRTAMRWLRAKEEGGSKALSNAKKGPKTGNMFDNNPALSSFIISQITGRPHLKTSLLREGIIAAGIEPVPSLSGLQQWVRKWKAEHARGMLRVSDPDAWRSKYGTAFGSRSEHIVRVNQLWEIDGTVCDVMCVTPEGGSKRYALTAIVDVFSRRAKVLVSRQPSAVSVGLLLRKAVLDWGLPETLKCDNGKDYTATYISRLALDMGFSLDFCAPFDPAAKPHVERFFGTMTRQLFEILPGYVGHNVAERQALNNRKAMADRMGRSERLIEAKLDGGEIQSIIDAWIETDYHTRTHEALKTSPMLRALDGGNPVLIEDERALDLLLATSPGTDGVRKVLKRGVKALGRTYIAQELGGMVGERVFVKFDPSDPARIYCYSADRERFICSAEDPSMTEADRQQIALNAKIAQKDEARQFEAEVRAAQDAFDPEDFAPSILRSKAQHASKIVPFVPNVIPFNPDADLSGRDVGPGFARERAAANGAPRAPVPTAAPVRDEMPVERIEAMVAELDAKIERPVETWIRDDGTARPVFDDDVAFAQFIQTEPAPHPEDVALLTQYVSQSAALQLKLSIAGLSTFVTDITGVDL